MPVATRYQSEHPTLPQPSEFEVTDEIFNEFKAFIDPEKFEYDKVCEQGLESLQKVAKLEGYMNDSTQAVFKQLEKLLKHDLNHDLDNNRKEISRLLAQELLNRYYYQSGESEYEARHDETLDKVAELLAKPGEWAKTLK